MTRWALRLLIWLGSVLVGLVGLSAVVVPWTDGEDHSRPAAVVMTLFGVVLAEVPLLHLVRWWLDRRPARRVHLVPGPALRIGLRQSQLVGTVLLASTWSAFLGAVVVAAGVPGPGLLVLPFLLLTLALVPDCLRALRRRAHLLVDAEGVRLRGWQDDVAIAWIDVEDVVVAAEDPRRPVLRVQGRRGAPSWRDVRRRLVLRLDPRRVGERLEVPLRALDDPGRLAAHLIGVHGDHPERRSRWFDEDAVAFLSDRWQRSEGRAAPPTHEAG